MLTKNRDKCASPNPELVFDEACLDIFNNFNESIDVFGQYNECDGCKFQTLATVPGGSNTSILVNTQYSLHLNYTNTNNTICEFNKLFYEHYRYGWNLTEKCSPIYIKEPADSAYLPILTAFIILFTFGTLWYMIKCIYKCTKNNETLMRYFVFSTELENDLGNPPGTAPLVIERPPPIRKHPHRVKSIDVFRGLCIMLMIFVNYGGGQYWFFKHSVWNGLTVADLVFPWFLWLMGMSLSISLNNKLRRAVPRRQLFMQVIRRSLILIFLGVVLNSHGKTTTLVSLRYPGVLQRIGVTYLIVGLIEATFAKRSVSVHEFGRLSFLQDVLVGVPQWIIMCILVFTHTAITFMLDVPECGRGYLGPGGLQDLGHYTNCTGGSAGYIDRLIFGEHMYKTPSCHIVYETTAYYDPEGILGTFTSVLLVYFGVQAGRILHTYSNVKTRVIRWVTWGVVTGLIGAILCGFSKNNGIIPVNKNLWSLSFVLTVGGLAFIIEAYLFVMVDILRKWGGRPLFYPGMNPIFLYVGHELLRNTFPFAWTPVNKTHAAYLSMNLWGMALWVVISVFLYKQNIFLTI